MEYIAVSIFGYLIGSIPFAYLVLKKFKGVDIRNSGSGNVGAMNSYEVSNSKRLGFLVFLLDFVKGIIAVGIPALVLGYDINVMLVSLFFAVLGHCFSVWLKFKGGKGLAAAAGGSLVFVPSVLIIWIFFWVTSYFIKKKINLSNIIATVGTIFLIVLYGDLLNFMNFATIDNPYFFKFGASAVMLIILLKHHKNISALLKNN